MRIFSFFVLLCITLLFGNCSKERGCRNPHAINYSPTAEVGLGTCQLPELDIKINLVWGTAPFEKNRIYNLNGHNTAIKELDCFFSNFEIVSDSIQEIQYIKELIPAYNLMKPDDNTFSFGILQSVSIKKISFQVGIDPSSNTNNNGLSQAYPAMHWNSVDGYIFLNMKGKVDRNGDGIPNENEAFDFEIGTDSLLQYIELDTSILITEELYTLELELDVLQLLNNVDLQTEQSTHTLDNPVLATKIAHNIPAAISLKK